MNNAHVREGTPLLTVLSSYPMNNARVGEGSQ